MNFLTKLFRSRDKPLILKDWLHVVATTSAAGLSCSESLLRGKALTLPVLAEFIP